MGLVEFGTEPGRADAEPCGGGGRPNVGCGEQRGHANSGVGAVQPGSSWFPGLAAVNAELSFSVS